MAQPFAAPPGARPCLAAPPRRPIFPEVSIEAITTRLDDAVHWARKFSLFQYPFVTACCAMEFMAVAAPKYDIARFGAEFPRFSPRQADLLIVVGTLVEKLAPALHRIHEQMAEPKWVIAFGVCASSGGFYQNYGTVPGIDQIVPVDVYIPGCPPRPEQVLDGLMLLQDAIARGGGRSARELLRGGRGDLLHGGGERLVPLRKR